MGDARGEIPLRDLGCGRRSERPPEAGAFGLDAAAAIASTERGLARAGRGRLCGRGVAPWAAGSGERAMGRCATAGSRSLAEGERDVDPNVPPRRRRRARPPRRRRRRSRPPADGSSCSAKPSARAVPLPAGVRPRAPESRGRKGRPHTRARRLHPRGGRLHAPQRATLGTPPTPPRGTGSVRDSHAAARAPGSSPGPARTCGGRRGTP